MEETDISNYLSTYWYRNIKEETMTCVIGKHGVGEWSKKLMTRKTSVEK